eukprot:3015586-Pyramimonas_sp.AAC.1
MAISAVVSTLAGTGVPGYQDGEGNAAKFAGPQGVAVDGDGNVIVAEFYNNRIRKISPQGLVSTLAGTGERGHRDGVGNAAKFKNPSGVAVDWEGNIFVAEYGNDRIRKISSQGVVSTLAGSGVQGFRDSIAGAQFNNPWGVAVDREGN